VIIFADMVVLDFTYGGLVATIATALSSPSMVLPEPKHPAYFHLKGGKGRGVDICRTM
jgi:hypothetical protein